MNIIPTIGFTNEQIIYEKIVDNIILSKSEMIRCSVSKKSIEDHLSVINNVKDLYFQKTNKKLKLMLDIPIPKDKVRIFLKDDLKLNKDEIVQIRKKSDFNDNSNDIFVEAEFSNILVDEILIIGNGDVRLKVLNKSESALTCKVMNPCVLSNGLAITAKDGFIRTTIEQIKIKCFQLIKNLKPELVVLSYVEDKTDIIDFKCELVEYTEHTPKIMSKVECYKALINIESIINNSDSIMLARGCLATNIGAENLLFAQDKVIEICKEKNIDVCIASNILKSFSKDYWPTRSEICDASYIVKSGYKDIVITNAICQTNNYSYLTECLFNLNKIYNGDIK